MIFVAHNVMIISRAPKIFIFSGLPLCKKRLIELLHRCMKRSHQKKMRWLFESWHTFKIFVDFDLPQDYEDQIGIGSPQIWMWVSAGGWGNNPRGSSRRLLLITASFTGSDTEIDGAGKIGLAVKENKDPLVFEARDKDSEEALVLSDSANFFLAWPEDISEGLSPLLFPRLNRIIDRCCAVELSKISLNFLNFIILS